MINDLIDEEPIDPKKLFDETQYNTLVVGRDGFTKKENITADLIEKIISNDVTRAEAEECFGQLKNLNAKDLLIQSLKEIQNTNHKAHICAACWESGLDFSSEFLYFVQLACDPELVLAMEALTVIEQCDEKIGIDVLATGLTTVKDSNSVLPAIKEDLIAAIQMRMSS